MKYEIEKLDHNMAKITIEVDTDQLEGALDRAYLKERKDISIPGFRKGKVPRKVIEKYYGKEVFLGAAADMIMPEAYAEAYDEIDLEIMSRPEIDVVTLEAGKPFVFTAEVAVKPEVKLGEYKGLEVAKQDASLTDEEIERAVKQFQDRNARTVEVTDRAVQDGDMIKLDFDGYVDGEQFEGGKSEDYPLTIGSGSFIPGFEEQLIGVAVGEEKDVNVTFPEDYNAGELAGKDAVFKCKVNGISARELPEMNDEFISDVTEFETVDEFKKDLVERLTKQKEEAALHNKENDAVAALVAASEMDIPDPIVEEQIDTMVNEFSQQMSMQGLSMDQYLQFTGSTSESFRASLKDDALKRVQSRLVMEKVVEAEKIETSEERFTEELQKMAEMYDMELDKIKELFPEEQAEAMKLDLAIQEAISFITDAAVEVEKAEEAEETEE